MSIAFQCKCGKKLKVQDDLAGKKVKCPVCGRVTDLPAVTVESLLPEDSAKHQVSAPTKKCPTCGADVKVGEPVCLKCGTMLSPVAGGKESAIRPLYQKPLFWVVIIAIIGCAFFGYINFIHKPPEDNTSPNQTGPGSQQVIQITPEQKLVAELENSDTANLDKLAESLIGLRDKSVGIIGTAIKNNKKASRLKAFYGLYLLSYYKCYRPGILAIVDATVHHQIADDEAKQVIMEILYLLSTDEPEPSLLNYGDTAKKYKEQFAKLEKSPTAGFARNILTSKFTSDSNDLVKARALVYLISLGDKHQLRPLIGVLKNPPPAVDAFIRKFLADFTGFALEKMEDWDKWYSESRYLSRTRWLINSLSETNDPQRLQNIEKLIKITDKDSKEFSYPADAPEEKKQEIISKWKEFGKTIK